MFGRDLLAAGIRVAVFDILLIRRQSRASMLAKAKNGNVAASIHWKSDPRRGFGNLRGHRFSAIGVAKEAAIACARPSLTWTSILSRRKRTRDRRILNHERNFYRGR